MLTDSSSLSSTTEEERELPGGGGPMPLPGARDSLPASPDTPPPEAQQHSSQGNRCRQMNRSEARHKIESGETVPRAGADGTREMGDQMSTASSGRESYVLRREGA